MFVTANKNYFFLSDFYHSCFGNSVCTRDWTDTSVVCCCKLLAKQSKPLLANRINTGTDCLVFILE